MQLLHCLRCIAQRHMHLSLILCHATGRIRDVAGSFDTERDRAKQGYAVLPWWHFRAGRNHGTVCS